MYEDLIHALFPHRDGHDRPQYRPHQFEVIRDVLAALDDPSTGDVIVEAPTGAGKTSIAVTVARVLTRGFDRVKREAADMAKSGGDPFAHMAEHQVHLITSMKMLQNAYLGDDPDIKLVKGKASYECGRGAKREKVFRQMEAAIKRLNVTFSCDDADQIFGHLCDPCPYRQARDAALWAPVALHNFDSFLHQATLGQVFGPRRLLAFDEAHNCEEKLRSFMTMSFGKVLFESLGLVWEEPVDLKDMPMVHEWGQRCLNQISAKTAALNREVTEARTEGNPEAIVHAAQAGRVLRRVSMLQDRLGRFCTSMSLPRPMTWVAYYNDAHEVTLEPVEAGRFVPSALMRFGRQRLHLSATFLNGGGAYSRSINLRLAKHITVPSTFAPERRQIVVRSAGKLSQKNWDQKFPEVVARVKEVLKENPGVRGVLHCTSYDMAKSIHDAVKSSRLVFYEREQRDVVIGDFLAGIEARDAVLVAVALNEGYDFKDDICRFQIIVRVPYLVPTDCVNARRALDPRFYGWRTALALVQVYGRGMRSAEDWCRTYILDERFEDFVQRERDQLPGWFLEAIS